jgi:trans-aconitate methyltransferase
MSTSLIYRSSSLYELVMLALYGRHYASRYQAIADLIPNGTSVVDLCCGPALLYHRSLKEKNVQYTGLDVNPWFISQLIKRGGQGQDWDLRSDTPLPKADYLVMQASLYHFLPDPKPVVDRMLKAARRQVIIAEPVRNLATSESRLLSMLGRVLTNPGVGEHSLRFNLQTLDEFFSGYGSRVMQSFSIAGGREKVYVLS